MYFDSPEHIYENLYTYFSSDVSRMKPENRRVPLGEKTLYTRAAAGKKVILTYSRFFFFLLDFPAHIYGPKSSALSKALGDNRIP